MDKITNEIQSSQELDDYTEIDLKKWLIKLEELRTMLDTPVPVDILFDNHSETSIGLIKMNSSQLHPSMYSSLEQNSQRLSSLYTQDRFDYLVVNGKSILTDTSNQTIQSGDDGIQECSFPWKILVALWPRNGSIHILS